MEEDRESVRPPALSSEERERRRGPHLVDRLGGAIGVKQTILYDPELQAQEVYGNCLQAAVATLLDLPLDAVPHFSAFYWWPQAMTLWAYGRGLQVRGRACKRIPKRHCVVGGKSPRGVAHVVVGAGSRIVWDPHPDGTGLSEVTDCTWFEPLDEGAHAPLLWGPVVAASSLEAEGYTVHFAKVIAKATSDGR